MQFEVGSEKKMFSVYRKAILSVFPSFSATINIPFGGHGGHLVWPSMPVDTFVNLAQYAYTGDYVLAGHKIDGELTVVKTGAKRKRRVVDVKTIDYSALFLGHARLYAVATTYKVESLQKLALSKIEHILDHFSESVGNHSRSPKSLAVLAKFAFSDDALCAKAGDSLRKLVLRYAMNNLCWDGWDKGYVELLKNEGAFAKSFWTEALKEI